MILTRSISSYHWRCIARNTAGDTAYYGRCSLRAARSVLRLTCFALVAIPTTVLLLAACGLRHVLWRIDPNLLYEIEHDGPAPAVKRIPAPGVPAGAGEHDTP